MAKIKALIFDQDGVIIDTERDGHRVAFNQTFKEFGYDFEWDVEKYHDPCVWLRWRFRARARCLAKVRFEYIAGHCVVEVGVRKIGVDYPADHAHKLAIQVDQRPTRRAGIACDRIDYEDFTAI